MNIKHIIVSIFVASICVSAHGKNLIYLENQFNAEIICKIQRNQSDPHMLTSNQDIPIAHGVRVCLGVVPLDTNLMRLWVNSVEIKASRYLPISSYVSLDSFVDKAVKQLVNCQANNLCDKDVVLVIHPSYIISNWDVSIKWEKTQGIVGIQ